MSITVQSHTYPELTPPSEPITDSAASDTATPSEDPLETDVNSVPDSDDEYDHPTINDVESLMKGIIKTSKNRAQAPYTILLVGETGVGKSSVMEFIANVLSGNDSKHYDFDILDHGNEEGGPNGGSQTDSARVYEIKSNSDILVRILDTPGLADTRGLQQDEIHKRSIATEIHKNIELVNAVLILANGTVPRITVGTDYALSTLSAIFPKTLAQNIAFLFTNVSSALSWNFAQGTVPAVLKEAPQYLLDNPIALQKKYLKLKEDPSMKRLKGELRKAVKTGEQKALEMLVDLFDWLDGLKPQPTTEILYLYEQSQSIEAKLANTLAQMDQATNKKAEIDRLMGVAKKHSVDMLAFSNFEKIISQPIWKQQPTTTHNTLCAQTGCYKNCHENCSLRFSLDPKGLEDCEAMNGYWCVECSHSLSDHHHYRVKWEQVIDRQVSVDKDMKEKWTNARNDKERQEAIITGGQKALDELNKGIDDGMKELAQLAEDYAGMSLSGGFSSQMEKAVRLLEQSYRNMEEKGVVQEQLRRMKESLDVMEKKLNLLKEAKEKRERESLAIGPSYRDILPTQRSRLDWW